MKTFLFILIVMIIGALTPYQHSVNAQIGAILKSPFYGTLVNFIVGTAALLILLTLLKPDIPSLRQLTSIPPYLYLGGVIGVALVTAIIIALPKIGATNALMAMIVGQMLSSILIDHYGWLGVPENTISLSRLAGAGLLLTGLYLVQRTG